MKNIFVWSKVFLITLILAIPVSLSILVKERLRKNAIIDQEVTYYDSLQKDLINFKEAQDSYIAEQTIKNKQTMDLAKTTYNNLLKQQPSIIADNSPYIQVAQATSNTSSSTSQSTVKPTSTRKTKTS